ncbi:MULTISPECIES: dienelactone hydrolase family protein [Amycolatopsis]|uniref:dienelactone hydrolase family protein n=1 Tax=Amycolatopsis TaxID=1813 RepID=UPI0033BAE11A
MSDVVMIRPARSAIGTLPVLEIALGGAPRGLVVLLCGPGGLDRDATEVMNRLAEHGYETLAAEARGRVLEPLVQRAAERGWTGDQIGLLGLGRGGRAVLDAAAEWCFGAAVSLSPSGPLAGVAAVRTPWLGLFGAEDPGVSAEEVRALGARLAAGTDVYSQVVTYPGVGADFHRRQGDGVSYAASYDGWQRAIEWLELRVAPRLTPLAEQWRRRRAAVSG